MRGDRRVVDDDLRLAHQLIAILHVAGKAHERVHHPEFGHGQRHVRVVPGDAHAFGFELERTVLDHCLLGHGSVQGIDATEQSADARSQMMQADILGQVIVGAEAQAGDDVEIRIARGQKNDRQRGRLRAQFAAQIETAFGFVAQAHIDDHQFGQALRKRAARIRARGETLRAVAEAVQCFDIVCADRGFIFDDGDIAAHGAPCLNALRPAYGHDAPARNGGGRFALTSPQLVGAQSQSRPQTRLCQGDSFSTIIRDREDQQAAFPGRTFQGNQHERQQPRTQCRAAAILRTARFAIFALLLGAIAALQF